MKRLIGKSLIAISLQLCGFAYAYELTDVRVNALAVADVLTAKCASVYPSDRVYSEYRKAASRLLSVASVNTELYNSSYQKVLRVASSKNSEELKSDCERFIPRIADMIPEMHTDYKAYLDILSADERSQADAWSSALELFASAAIGLGQAAQAGNYSFIPIPSGRVTFGGARVAAGAYNHYLVNTPSGQSQCHVADSGYIFCN